MAREAADETAAVAFDIKQAIARVTGGGHLTADEIAGVFGAIMDGAATPSQIGGLLVALRMKGETADELAGAARAMRARATPLACPDPDRGVDTCGTGGDGSGTVNVSTLAAIVVAAVGGVVAKHGNRALSSKSGSADVLEALGVTIDAPAAVVERCMREAGIGFAFAPAFHAATRHAAGPRRELGVRTLFNLLGPMTNPARVDHQVIGVYDGRWCAPVASALGKLGSRRVVVVHGAGGIDEVAVRGATSIAEWNGTVTTYELSPRDFGLVDVDPAGLAGGDATHNAAILRRVLGGDAIGAGEALEAVANAACMTAALAMRVTRGLAVDDLRAGTAAARETLHDGRATRVLDSWIRISREPA
jgi:anthranilate phosphoribosyltransferase